MNIGEINRVLSAMAAKATCCKSYMKMLDLIFALGTRRTSALAALISNKAGLQTVPIYTTCYGCTPDFCAGSGTINALANEDVSLRTELVERIEGFGTTFSHCKDNAVLQEEFQQVAIFILQRSQELTEKLIWLLDQVKLLEGTEVLKKNYNDDILYAQEVSGWKNYSFTLYARAAIESLPDTSDGSKATWKERFDAIKIDSSKRYELFRAHAPPEHRKLFRDPFDFDDALSLRKLLHDFCSDSDRPLSANHVLLGLPKLPQIDLLLPYLENPSARQGSRCSTQIRIRFTQEWVEETANLPPDILEDPFTKSEHSGSDAFVDDGDTSTILPDSVDHVPPPKHTALTQGILFPQYSPFQPATTKAPQKGILKSNKKLAPTGKLTPSRLRENVDVGPITPPPEYRYGDDTPKAAHYLQKEVRNNQNRQGLKTVKKIQRSKPPPGIEIINHYSFANQDKSLLGARLSKKAKELSGVENNPSPKKMTPVPKIGGPGAEKARRYSIVVNSSAKMLKTNFIREPPPHTRRKTKKLSSKQQELLYKNAEENGKPAVIEDSQKRESGFSTPSLKVGLNVSRKKLSRTKIIGYGGTYSRRLKKNLENQTPVTVASSGSRKPSPSYQHEELPRQDATNGAEKISEQSEEKKVVEKSSAAKPKILVAGKVEQATTKNSSGLQTVARKTPAPKKAKPKEPAADAKDSTPSPIMGSQQASKLSSQNDRGKKLLVKPFVFATAQRAKMRKGRIDPGEKTEEQAPGTPKMDNSSKTIAKNASRGTQNLKLASLDKRRKFVKSGQLVKLTTQERKSNQKKIVRAAAKSVSASPEKGENTGTNKSPTGSRRQDTEVLTLLPPELKSHRYLDSSGTSLSKSAARKPLTGNATAVVTSNPNPASDLEAGSEVVARLYYNELRSDSGSADAAKSPSPVPKTGVQMYPVRSSIQGFGVKTKPGKKRFSQRQITVDYGLAVQKAESKSVPKSVDLNEDILQMRDEKSPYPLPLTDDEMKSSRASSKRLLEWHSGVEHTRNDTTLVAMTRSGGAKENKASVRTRETDSDNKASHDTSQPKRAQATNNSRRKAMFDGKYTVKERSPARSNTLLKGAVGTASRRRRKGRSPSSGQSKSSASETVRNQNQMKGKQFNFDLQAGDSNKVRKFMRKAKPSLQDNPRFKSETKPAPRYLYFETKILPRRSRLILERVELTPFERKLKRLYEDNDSDADHRPDFFDVQALHESLQDSETEDSSDYAYGRLRTPRKSKARPSTGSFSNFNHRTHSWFRKSDHTSILRPLPPHNSPKVSLVDITLRTLRKVKKFKRPSWYRLGTS